VFFPAVGRRRTRRIGLFISAFIRQLSPPKQLQRPLFGWYSRASAASWHL
jgi:hypothetical protein